MVEGRNDNLYGSLDWLNKIYLHGWNPRVCLNCLFNSLALSEASLKVSPWLRIFLIKDQNLFCLDFLFPSK